MKDRCTYENICYWVSNANLDEYISAAAKLVQSDTPHQRKIF